MSRDLSNVDWSATGSMLGGIGAIAAAVGSLVLIILTWRYVRINADLLLLNRDSLNTLKASVAANEEMARTMREQLGVAAAEAGVRLRQENEPFRHLIERMITGVERIAAVDIMPALRLPDSVRPDKSWFVLPDYFEKLSRAKDLDGVLHSMLEHLMETPNGELFLLQASLGRCANLARSQLDMSEDVRSATTDLQKSIEAARARLHQISSYIADRDSSRNVTL